MSTESDRAFAELLERLPPATCRPAECRHPDFAVSAVVARLEDSGRFVCELRVCCLACREPFRFLGMQPGLAFTAPRCSIDGREALLPIQPEIERRLFGSATYEAPPAAATKH